jgi:hypothetical protein
MKIFSAGAAGWIAFYIADHVLYGSHIVEALRKLASAVAAGMSVP